jgi:hypothetical protein
MQNYQYLINNCSLVERRGNPFFKIVNRESNKIFIFDDLWWRETHEKSFPL